MSIAMIGLIGFQAHWIKSAIEVNDVKFKQNVHEVLNSVVSNLEKREVYYAASKQITDRPPTKRIYQVDTNLYWADRRLNSQYNNIANRADQNKEKVYNRDTDFIFEDSLLLGNHKIRISYHISGNMTPDFPSFVEEEHYFSQNPFELGFMHFEDYEKEVRNSIQKIAEKSHMVTVALDDLLGEHKQISTRIDNEEIDNLLKDQLHMKGINIDYEYAVVDRGINHVVFSDYKPENEKDVLLSGFSTKLFPNDFSGGENYLTIFFPDQARFLFKQIWLTLTSGLFNHLLFCLCHFCNNQAEKII